MNHPSLNRRRSLAFHIEQDDYFGTLATIVDCARQDLRRASPRQVEPILQRLRDELLYLERQYRIVLRHQENATNDSGLRKKIPPKS